MKTQRMMMLLAAVLAMSVSLNSSAREKVAFIKEGKVWKCGVMSTAFWDTIPHSFYVMRGDSVIGRTVYKKVKLQSKWIYGDEEFHQLCCVREEGSRVYKIRDGYATEELLYDFSMREGDRLAWHDYSLFDSLMEPGSNYLPVPDMTLTCEEVSSTYVNHTGRRYLNCNWWTEGIAEPTAKVCVEGIGYSDDPFLCCIEDLTLSVEEDGEEVFEAGNFCHPENGRLPLLMDGKTWHYTYYNWATGQRYTFEERIDGDSIVGGTAYKKYHQHDGLEPVVLLREEGGKVYQLNRVGSEDLLYDFTLTVGDDITFFMPEENVVIAEEAMVTFGGISLKKLTLGTSMADEDMSHPVPSQVWVEGMGSDGGLLAPFFFLSAGGFVTLDYIELPGGEVFRFSDVSSVPSVQASSSRSSVVYDLQGRRVETVSIQNGKADLTGLPRGIYVVKSGSGTRKVAVK